MDCVTYSRNMTYAYKCNKFHTSQERGGESKDSYKFKYLIDRFICCILYFHCVLTIFLAELPLCIDTEDFNRYEIPAAGEVSSNKSSGSQTSGCIPLTSVRWTVLIILGSFCVFL